MSNIVPVPSYIDNDGVEWRFSDYQVNLDTSEVISLKFGKQKVRRCKQHKIGYYYLGLTSDDGRVLGTTLHRVIYAAKVGNWDWWIVEGKEIHHKDDNKSHNHWSNLEPRTHAEQYDEACRQRMSESLQGSKHPRATIDEEIARQIKLEYQESDNKISEFARDMADKFATSEGVVYQLVYGRTWKHVEI